MKLMQNDPSKVNVTEVKAKEKPKDETALPADEEGGAKKKASDECLSCSGLPRRKDEVVMR